jgi:putative long chain acyl-CoA synthase
LLAKGILCYQAREHHDQGVTVDFQSLSMKKGYLKYFRQQIKKNMAGVTNAAKIIWGQRFSPPHETPYELACEVGFARLRHYPARVESSALAGPLLLIPPLMLTAQVYDISPLLSAVESLCSSGIDVWVIDFGIPEAEPGGLNRTFDDHILVLDQAIDFMAQATGRPVHLSGYSQGGMFAYLVAAYRQSRQIASLITFGSPVDQRRNMPFNLHFDLASWLLTSLRSILRKPLEGVSGIPGSFSSLGFKLVSPRQEWRYLHLMLNLLDDRQALSQLEPTRRFLGGEGFIAWPGPAFRSFVDQVMIENRMLRGGLVINGRSVTLADITTPILYFVGLQDNFARPAAVRAIKNVAVGSTIYETPIHSGHFGLVVGSRAMDITWPTVNAWLKWQAALGPEPAAIRKVFPQSEKYPTMLPTSPAPVAMQELFEDIAAELWHRLGDISLDLTHSASWLRWQLPRLARIAKMLTHGKISIGQILMEQARKLPDKTFFLWEGRAYTYQEADIRVNQFASAIRRSSLGQQKGFGILMENHPDYLALIVAANRIGQVTVLLNTELRQEMLRQAIKAGEIQYVITDEYHLGALTQVLPLDRIYLLNTGKEPISSPINVKKFEDYLLPGISAPPAGIDINPMAPDDTAMLIFTSGTTGLPKAAKISNLRWFLAATAIAAGGSLTPNDTVYCCLPLYHGTGLILGAGGAMIGGCRLVLARRFSRSRFWNEVRQCGATVIPYVGDFCRYLVSAEPTPGEKNHPVRLFFGNGMQADVWHNLRRRFGKVQVLEFYAATEGNLILMNLTGEKIGAVGKPIMPWNIELVRYDPTQAEYPKDANGWLIPCQDNEPGMLIARISNYNPLTRFEGYLDRQETNKKILRDVFRPRDSWFVSGDILWRDKDGDYWFVDRVGDTFRFKGENIATEQVAGIIADLPFAERVVVYGVRFADREGRVGMAAIKRRPGYRVTPRQMFEHVGQQLIPAAIPRFIRIVDDFEMTASFKVVKHRLQAEGADPTIVKDRLYWYDASKGTYSRLNAKIYPQVIATLL